MEVLKGLKNYFNSFIDHWVGNLEVEGAHFVDAPGIMPSTELDPTLVYEHCQSVLAFTKLTTTKVMVVYLI